MPWITNPLTSTLLSLNPQTLNPKHSKTLSGMFAGRPPVHAAAGLDAKARGAFATLDCVFGKNREVLIPLLIMYLYINAFERVVIIRYYKYQIVVIRWLWWIQECCISWIEMRKSPDKDEHEGPYERGGFLIMGSLRM